MELIGALVVFVVAFFLGSIPWGVIISRVFYHTDIRQHGSGNIGTTNALRTMGKVGGGAVFLLDFGKGLASGLIALFAVGLFGGGTTLTGRTVGYSDFVTVAFLGCTWGHIFSPWLGFRGGKGIAVAIGCLFVTFGPVGAILELALFGVVVAVSKYVSAGSIAAAALCPVLGAYYFLICTFAPAAFACTLAVGLTVIWAHRGNIERLRAGTERRIGSKKTQA